MKSFHLESKYIIQWINGHHYYAINMRYEIKEKNECNDWNSMCIHDSDACTHEKNCEHTKKRNLINNFLFDLGFFLIIFDESS